MELYGYKAQLKDRLLEEFTDFISPGIRTLILFTGAMSFHLYKKKPIITTLGRTQEEQDEMYGEDPSYIEAPWKSYHQVWMAVDFRYAPFTFSEWAELLTIVEAVYKPHGIVCLVYAPQASPVPHVHIELHSHVLT